MDALPARSPYPERGDEKLGRMDFELTRLFAGFSSRLERHAASLAVSQRRRGLGA